jgi:site-specific DNA-cytosine methylase
MDTTQNINTIEWFFGYGGNHIGIKRILSNMRTIAICEIEAYAIENILAKMEEGKLDSAPIWPDCKTFPAKPFVNRIDLFIASYPCTPFSQVGKRQGNNDERHLWPYVKKWVGEVKPTICLFENVEGHITMGLPTVISDLEEMGYRTTWGIFSAAECGAPHERKRVFILAILDNSEFAGLERLIQSNSNEEGREDEGGPATEANICNWRRVKFADELPKCECCEEEWCEDCGTHYADCKCYGPTQDGLEFIECNEVLYARPESKWPSYPTEEQKKWEPSRIVTRSKSKLGREPDGTRNRLDRHILLGNGVVPDVAEKAFRVLFKRLINEWVKKNNL